MKVEDIRKVAVVGAGVMGHGIAQVFAQNGYEVFLYDISHDILQQALSRIESNLDTLIEHGLSTEEAKREALSRISNTTILAEAVKEADFITEATPEIIDLKKEVFRDIEAFCPDDAIIATNTSGLSIDEIGALCERQGNQVATHWFNPPYIIPGVEVVKGTMTSQVTFDCAYALMEKMGKKPARISKGIPGFIANRIQCAILRESLALLEAGVASAQDIDTVVKGTLGFRLPTIGPFETADFGGLDTWFNLAQDLFPQIDRSTEPPPLLREKVEQGKLGVKTGEGFYKYEGDLLDANIRERDRRFIQRLKEL